MNSERATQLNALTLAFVGDAVYTLRLRADAAERFDLKANKMDAYCRAFVCAEGQACAYRAIEPMLNEEETGIAHRARNSHPQNKAKSASLADYMQATALEAVVGFLYLTGREERLCEIIAAAMSAVGENGLIPKGAKFKR